MTVPFKTKGSSGLSIRDDVECSSAWHAKVSQSRALAAGSSIVKFGGRKLQIRRKGGENGNLAAVANRFKTEPSDVYSASTRTRCNLS